MLLAPENSSLCYERLKLVKNYYYYINSLFAFYILHLVFKNVLTFEQINFSKFSSDNILRVGRKNCPAALKSRSTEADDGRADVHE